MLKLITSYTLSNKQILICKKKQPLWEAKWSQKPQQNTRKLWNYLLLSYTFKIWSKWPQIKIKPHIAASFSPKIFILKTLKNIANMQRFKINSLAKKLINYNQISYNSIRRTIRSKTSSYSRFLPIKKQAKS